MQLACTSDKESSANVFAAETSCHAPAPLSAGNQKENRRHAEPTEITRALATQELVNREPVAHIHCSVRLAQGACGQGAGQAGAFSGAGLAVGAAAHDARMRPTMPVGISQRSPKLLTNQTGTSAETFSPIVATGVMVPDCWLDVSDCVNGEGDPQSLRCHVPRDEGEDTDCKSKPKSVVEAVLDSAGLLAMEAAHNACAGF